MSHSSLPATAAQPHENTVNDGAVLTGEGSVPEGDATVASGGGAEQKSVLLLEDDVSFRDVIRDFLEENGYSVVTGLSGVDGILAVLASDFAVVLCDMNMPGLAGDLFYRAVERARPALCERFVFMTGYRGDERANVFIKSVDCLTLMKPFPLDDLLAAVRTIESGRQSFDPPRPAAPPASGSLPAPGRPIPVPKVDLRAPQSAHSPTRKITIHAFNSRTSPAGIRAALQEDATESKSNGRSRFVSAILGLALFGAFAATAGAWYFGLRQRASVATAEVATLEARWACVSKLVQNAEQARPRLELSVALPKRIAAERGSLRWTRVLKSVAGAAMPGIELSDFQMREDKRESGVGELWIGGVATGAEPRTAADRFRQAVEVDLKHRLNQSIVSTRFERLEDEPASPDAPDRRRAGFTIIASAQARSSQDLEQGKDH